MTTTVDGPEQGVPLPDEPEDASARPPVSLQDLKSELTRFLMVYKFGIDEMMTKINILRDEFTYARDYNPIEHVKSRLKSPESIIAKARRKGAPQTLEGVREHVRDIAGIRITCSFTSDVYRIMDMITRQGDVGVVEIEDYIARPKPNGYRSVHVIVEIPVFMSDRMESVYVELQIRTVAMDFWASLEHKIYYKHDRAVPDALREELRVAAETARDLDVKMEALHDRVHGETDS
ncbi:GTP pyrophosphokinase [Rhodococcus artemisiae]|uniref:GTP pyrophosphokinase family protein n=1 Tax=Rhodococcus artemisiae TaxID=714159 RepID=A0ABU7L623_9NOCA|nr:GTP pyrophosphokinase family protein [Rhodococcus artemisiae]MEE2056797.1 GTP pyrophosphokinase family protein [Rhodococcus artemisiae]